MKHYLILLKGKKKLDYSPEALQKRLEEYRNWVDGIEHHFISDNRLEREGRLILEKGRIETDGPFLESKEIIAGFIIIRASNLDHATHIAEGSPLLKYFAMIIRPMIGE